MTTIFHRRLFLMGREGAREIGGVGGRGRANQRVIEEAFLG